MMDFVLPSSDDSESIEFDPSRSTMGAARLGVSKMTPMPSGKLDFTNFKREEPEIALNVKVPEALPITSTEGNDEVVRLKAKITDLKRIIEEMKPLIQEATDLERRHSKKSKHFKRRSTIGISKFGNYKNIPLIEEQIANSSPPPPKTPDELDEWADELEQEHRLAKKHNLDQDLKQLREDEESLEVQMRQMEVQMARERAMMARQETELKRLSAEITHELEIMQRGDGALREQLAKFQRRHQDVLAAAHRHNLPPRHLPPPTPEPQAEAQGSALYRMFRRNK